MSAPATPPSGVGGGSGAGNGRGADREPGTERTRAAAAVAVAALAAVPVALATGAAAAAASHVLAAAACGAAAARLWTPRWAWVAAGVAALLPLSSLLGPLPLALLALAPAAGAVLGAPRGAAGGVVAALALALCALAPLVAAPDPVVLFAFLAAAAPVPVAAHLLARVAPTTATVPRAARGLVVGLVLALLAAAWVAPRVDRLAALPDPDGGLAVAGLVLLAALQAPALLVAHRARDAARGAWPLAALAAAAVLALTIVVPPLPTAGVVAAYLLLAAVQAPAAAGLAGWRGAAVALAVAALGWGAAGI